MLEHQPYAFSLRRTAAYAVVHAAGELDVAAVPQLRTAVHAAGRHADHIVMDLRDVSFLDSFALRSLVRLQREGSDRPSFHVVPGEGIQQVLDLLGARSALDWISAEQIER